MSSDSLRDSEYESRSLIPFPNACAPLPVKEASPGHGDRMLLKAGRWWLIKSKLTPRAVVDEACFLLASGMPEELSAFGKAFFRLLDIHAKRSLRFFAPDVDAVTDDERWFLQLIKSAIDDDSDSVDALIGWRLDVPAQRRGAFLINQLAQFLREVDLEKDESIVI